MSDSCEFKISMKGCNMLNYLVFQGFFWWCQYLFALIFDVHGIFGNLDTFAMARALNWQFTNPVAFFFPFFPSPSLNMSFLSKLLCARPLCLQDNKNVKETCSRSVFCVPASEAEKIYKNVYSMILRRFLVFQSWFTKLVVLKIGIFLQISPWS